MGFKYFAGAVQDLLNDLTSISLSYSNFLKIHDKTRKDKGSKK